MTILNITAATSGGSAAAQAECWVRLMTGGTYGGSHNGTVIGQKEHFVLDNAGAYTFADGDLAPNSEIDPEGTIYHFRVNGGDYYIQLPDTGEYDLSDTSIWTVSTPPALIIAGQDGDPGPPGDLTVESDLVMPPTTVGSGTATGGSIRNTQSVIFKDWDYTQTTPPTDVAVGTAVHVPWDATVSAGSALTATGWFGPRAVFNQEGLVRFGVNQTAFSFGPIGFGDLLRQANTAGVARTLIPAWSFMSSRGIIADGAVVSLGQNDTNRGGAAFVNTAFYASINGGQISDLNNGDSMVGFYDAPVISGNVDIDTRVGFDAREVGIESAYNVILDSSSGAPPLTGNMDAHGGETLQRQIGFRAQFMDTATRNIGFWNGSAYVSAPQTSTLSAASSTIRIDSEYVLLDNTSGGALTLTSTPTIADGLDGQKLVLTNISANPVRLQPEVVLASTNVIGGGSSSDGIVLPQWATIALRFSTSAGGWVIESWPTSRSYQRWENDANGGASNSYVEIRNSAASPANMQMVLQDRTTSAQTLLSGGTVAISDGSGTNTGYLNHGGAADTLAVTSPLGVLFSTPGDGIIYAGQRQQIQAQTGTSYTVASGDKAKTITRSNGSASTQSWPGETGTSAAAIQIGTRIETVNLGAGTITHSAVGDGALVTGSSTSQAQGKRMTAIKVAANTWSLTISA